MRRLYAAIPDLHIKVEQVVVEGDVAAVRIFQTGTLARPLAGLDAAPGPTAVSATLLFRFRGEQVVEEWIDSDTTTLAPWSQRPASSARGRAGARLH
jgi:predicted ester cyclase